jgi:YhcH/YjgK/YiaL family protein
MIVDNLDNLGYYLREHPFFKKLKSFLKKAPQMPSGRYEIDGDKIFAVVSQNPKAFGALEAHRRYVDVQCIFKGTDIMGYKFLKSCKTIKMPYDKTKDAAFYKDKPDLYVEIPKNHFAIFYPFDAHQPLARTKGNVKKCIIKISAEILID